MIDNKPVINAIKFAHFRVAYTRLSTFGCFSTGTNRSIVLTSRLTDYFCVSLSIHFFHYYSFKSLCL